VIGCRTGFWHLERADVVGMSPSCESMAPMLYAEVLVCR